MKIIVFGQAQNGLLVIWAPKVTLTKPFKYNGLCFEAGTAENLGVSWLRYSSQIIEFSTGEGE